MRHHEPENGPWEMHSITIRSPYIRKVLATAFEGYPGIDAKLEDMTFRAPFHELFFRWSKFLDMLLDETDEKIKPMGNLTKEDEDKYMGDVSDLLDTWMAAIAVAQKHVGRPLLDSQLHMDLNFEL